MKKIKSFLVLVVLILASCANQEAKKEIIPSAPDYSDAIYWFTDPAVENQKPVDIFYVYPTLPSNPVDANGNSLNWTNIDQPSQRKVPYSNQQFFQTVYAGDDYNFYAPYYRQIILDIYRSDRKARLEKSKIPVEDIANAFQYYMKHFNNGRPFILMGYSQGASVLIELLKNSMTDAQFQQMIAAYMIGFEIRSEDLTAYPHRLISAKDSSDTHCIIVYNSLTNPKAVSPILSHNAMGINPINWKTDTTMATKEEHLGMALWNAHNATYTLIPHVTGGYLNNHNMICTDIDPQDCYAEGANDLFPLGNLHLMEAFLYAGNLQHNIKTRTESFFKQQEQ
ncbi:MAG: DUF3089 domain-containing protein [Bacteroidales bacterium]|jgi:hypothetical protein|nr:DUF3089 domain-containing protein [Bacteroidales bacterium]